MIKYTLLYDLNNQDLGLRALDLNNHFLITPRATTDEPEYLANQGTLYYNHLCEETDYLVCYVGFKSLLSSKWMSVHGMTVRPGGGGEEGVINKMINNINGWTVAWNYLGISFPSPEANSGYPVAVWWAHPIGCIATGCTWASMCHPFGSNQCNERDQEQRKVQNLWHRNSTSIISLKQIIQMRGKGYRLKTLITICNNQKLASAYMSNNHNNYRDFLVTYENV